ncbi:MAG: helix-turn-helix transcriptional regulator [Nanoarchaeota archaeon]|nr:helix-turn-helix transcriptional regulator [Nanoarchaeota archaeon]
MNLNIPKIEKEINRLGLTHTSLAKLMNKSRTTVVTLLHKKKGGFTLKTVENFARALELDPKDLIL